jgi:hypothetical protein
MMRAPGPIFSQPEKLRDVRIGRSRISLTLNPGYQPTTLQGKPTEAPHHSSTNRSLFRLLARLGVG